ncbi:hypothetical protein FGO68_gene11093 [Halteria grandinella]|uniref:Ankyrin repeat domain-containing protein n=1 Tax=Halteria grandinella TaxID=5974 RepID=A0A8J8NSP7_HALGN|nr:hypothetical protein FGO68_gene11093 [Halteria grandinella]
MIESAGVRELSEMLRGVRGEIEEQKQRGEGDQQWEKQLADRARQGAMVSGVRGQREVKLNATTFEAIPPHLRPSKEGAGKDRRTDIQIYEDMLDKMHTRFKQKTASQPLSFTLAPDRIPEKQLYLRPRVIRERAQWKGEEFGNWYQQQQEKVKDYSPQISEMFKPFNLRDTSQRDEVIQKRRDRVKAIKQALDRLSKQGGKLEKSDSHCEVNQPFQHHLTRSFFKAVSLGKVPESLSYLKQDRSLALQYDLVKQTALHIAAKLGNPDITRMLIKSKADVNFRDIYGRTPLFYAINSLECTGLLLANMSSAFAIDNEGYTVEDMADSQQREVIELIRKGKLFQVVVKFLPKAEREERMKGMEVFKQYII